MRRVNNLNAFSEAKIKPENENKLSLGNSIFKKKMWISIS